MIPNEKWPTGEDQPIETIGNGCAGITIAFFIILICITVIIYNACT